MNHAYTLAGDEDQKASQCIMSNTSDAIQRDERVPRPARSDSYSDQPELSSRGHLDAEESTDKKVSLARRGGRGVVC